MKKLFLEEFGKTPDDLFNEFDYQPIAAASLAQVFKAKTKDGKDVAVKVQYIDLIKRFSGDFSTILILQDLVKLVHKQYNFDWILRDLRKNLEQVYVIQALTLIINLNYVFVSLGTGFRSRRSQCRKMC